jgi:hypothetical protein
MKILGINVDNNNRMFHAQNPDPYLQGKFSSILELHE